MKLPFVRRSKYDHAMDEVQEAIEMLNRIIEAGDMVHVSELDDIVFGLEIVVNNNELPFTLEGEK
jgi:hypothetical protein